MASSRSSNALPRGSSRTKARSLRSLEHIRLDLPSSCDALEYRMKNRVRRSSRTQNHMPRKNMATCVPSEFSRDWFDSSRSLDGAEVSLCLRGQAAVWYQPRVGVLRSPLAGLVHVLEL